MAVGTPTDVAATSTAQGNASSLSISSAVTAGSDRLGIVTVRWSSGTISSISWGASTPTLVTGTSGGTGSNNIAIYELVAPPTASSTITVNFSGMNQCSIRAYYVTGAHQTTPTQNGNVNTGTAATSASQVVSSATGNQVIDAISTAQNVTVGSGQTQIGATLAQGGIRHSDSYEAGAASVTMSWTFASSDYAHAAADIVSAGASNQNIDGDAVFAPSLSFPAGKFTHYVSGDAVFAPSLSFPTGSVNQRISGDAVFAPTLSFPTGTVTQRISGDAVFAPTLSFPTGKFTHNIVGDAVFTPTLSFPVGSVTLGGASQNIDGDAVFAPALSFPDGKFTHNIAGDAVFAPALSFFDGTITQRLSGDAVFAPALSFPTGKFTHNIVGDAVFAPAISFFDGNVAWVIAGDGVFTPALSFPNGAVIHYIQGDAVFAPALSFPDGSIRFDIPPMDLWLQVNLHRVW